VYTITKQILLCSTLCTLVGRRGKGCGSSGNEAAVYVEAYGDTLVDATQEVLDAVRDGTITGEDKVVRLCS
jgi:hypothetical protein